MRFFNCGKSAIATQLLEQHNHFCQLGAKAMWEALQGLHNQQLVIQYISIKVGAEDLV
jgi:hypothetical protein